MLVALLLACAQPDPDSCAEGTEVGDCAPDFSLQANDGQWISRADFGDEPLIVEFGAAWCGNCQAMSSELEALSQEGYAVLMVLYEDARGGPPSPADAQAWVDHFDLSYPVLVDPGATVTMTWNHSGSIPETYLVDDGLVRWRHVGKTGGLKRTIARELER